MQYTFHRRIEFAAVVDPWWSGRHEEFGFWEYKLKLENQEWLPEMNPLWNKKSRFIMLKGKSILNSLQPVFLAPFSSILDPNWLFLTGGTLLAEDHHDYRQSFE